ncbi:uncharacterized protein LOC106170672 [Lingula anatina]|uniref:Uncharacterized protein LOC106170672 n=1 Tax=Lingula anatina TaxID=7574 RepID=A0A1S3J713_LINAN|nr:uncharacterized protein LOC106170672 [Lingula anatina]|eukprot:XP_013406098.1 uncharacterized protein LOC106170672 [Lingula anatina]
MSGFTKHSKCHSQKSLMRGRMTVKGISGSVTFAYRTAQNCATGYCSFFLMFNREARLPCKLRYIEKEVTMPSKEDCNVQMEFQHQQLTELHAKICITRRKLKSLKQSTRDSMRQRKERM